MLQDKPPTPAGNHYSLLPPRPIIDSAFALHLGLFTHKLTPCVYPSGIKLEISVNIDARTLKFGMKHPWTQSLRYRENQISCMSASLLVGLLPY